LIHGENPPTYSSFNPFRPSVLNNPEKPVDMGVQADLAIHILKAAFVEQGRKCPFAYVGTNDNLANASNC
jgi:hypothetical protein